MKSPGKVILRGHQPYALAVLHGGPGAPGSLASLAEHTSLKWGTLEPYQSQESIENLITELNIQIESNCHLPISLIGHSWGAWLAIWFATTYPKMVKKIILIGTPPFEEKYIPLITHNRLQRLGKADRNIFLQLLENLDHNIDNETFFRLKQLIDQSDNYEIEDYPTKNFFDSRQYEMVWNEAATFRKNGGFTHLLPRLQCPVVVVHGAEDPHPLSGIVQPLQKAEVSFGLHVLSHCGHSPFLEKEASEKFFGLLDNLL